MADDEIGSTANKYEIVAKLATGGMAEIYLARNESTAGVERYVVLKRVLRRHANDIKFVNMFLDEARLSARLQHPNIAQVYDTGKLGDSYFFTMEYVHGETVRDILHETFEAKQQVPVAVALTIIAGAAAGLQHAHERVGFDGRPLGIVHRDVSPSNLMVSYEGSVKLVDFGVAKATHRAQETQTGAVKGKVGYMSPEQIRSTVVDARSDLFSLGIVMWELLVGDRLFKRAADFETMEAIISEPVAPPSTHRADLGPEIDAIVCKLLEKSPARRFQTANELLEALDVATVRAGLSLSVSGVRRFMRELFGVRVEPWVEMARGDGHTDVITVTAKPEDLDDDEQLSAQLDHLLDLSTLTPGTASPLEESCEASEGEWQPRLVRAAAAISATSPTVADGPRAAHTRSASVTASAALRPVSVPLPSPPLPAAAPSETSTPAPHVRPLASVADSMPMPMPVVPVAVARLADSEALSRRRLSMRLLAGGGLAACAVLAVLVTTGRTAETSARPQQTEGARTIAVPAASTATEAPIGAATPQPTVARDRDDAGTPKALAAPSLTRASAEGASPRPHAASSLPAARTPISKRPRSRPAGDEHKQLIAPTARESARDEAATLPDVKRIERTRPDPSTKVNARCDESDPLACRR